LISFIAIPFFVFSLDIFLEGFSLNRDTGRIRGSFLSLTNLAWVFPPLISGLILSSKDYSKIYLASLFLLLPIFLVFSLGLRRFKDSEYKAVPIWSTACELWQNKNLVYIFGVDFLLQFFYSWMTIYTPIYLYQNFGFSWLAIGLIFTIMLLPFVFIQFPLGNLADKKWGEKEMLSIGFVIVAISTGVISFVTSHSLWLWAGILFMTRIGASVIEVMGDTYFFKKADGLNANIISLFRSARPLAYILGPLFATILLNVFSMPIKYTFLVLGVIMFFGLRFSLVLKDTK
jgi:MFS family permease